jgi:hypothetical protein
VQLGGFTIADQAYIEALPADNTANSPGIIGLGPASGSLIFNDYLGDASGSPFLDRVFANGSVPAYITTTCAFVCAAPSFICVC